MAHGKNSYLSLNLFDIYVYYIIIINSNIIGLSIVKDFVVTAVVVIVIVTISYSEGCISTVVKRGLECKTISVALNQRLI